MGSSADRISNEVLIKEHLRDIMRTEDLDNLTSKMVRHVGTYKEEVGLNKIRTTRVCMQAKIKGQRKKKKKQENVCMPV